MTAIASSGLRFRGPHHLDGGSQGEAGSVCGGWWIVFWCAGVLSTIELFHHDNFTAGVPGMLRLPYSRRGTMNPKDQALGIRT